jgi:POT family proton-dependent oligopeptide transporter
MSSAPNPSPKHSDSPSHATKMYQALVAEHPPALYQLCFSVLCERWAAFMLTATAALMLCERFGFPRADALRLWGIVSAASYIGSLPGGHILDQTRSAHRGFIASLLILLLGYLALSMPYRGTALTGFALLVIGHAAYKPSTQRALRMLYSTADPRLEGAQVLLHIAINLGAAAGSFLAGILVRFAGWGITYSVSALTLGIGIAVLWQQELIHSPTPPTSTLDENGSQQQALRSEMRSVPFITALIFAMFLLTLATAQAEGALLLWASHRTDTMVFGFNVPVAWFVTFAAVMVLLLSPLQLALLPLLKRSLGSTRLVALGLVSIGLCFAVLSPTVLWTSRVSILWLLGSLTFFVVAEMLVAPIGLALLLRSVPSRFIGRITGVWYGAGALGYFAGGEIGALWSRWPTHRVLLLLTVLPLLGAILLGLKPRSRNVRYSLIFATSAASAPGARWE